MILNPCFHGDGKKPPRVKHPLGLKMKINQVKERDNYGTLEMS